MATTIPAGTRLIGDVIRGAAVMERIRKAVGAIPQEQAKEADCSKESSGTDCKECKLQQGMVLPSDRRRAVTKNNKVNWDYQLFIANLHANPETFSYCDKTSGVPLTDFDFAPGGRIWKAVKGEPQPSPENLNLTEWCWEKRFWDGFWRDDCCLVEAKGRFRKHLGDDGLPNDGFPKMFMFPEMIAQAASQVVDIAPALPQAKLQWHFMESETFAWARINLPPPIVCFHTPYLPRPSI